MLETMPDVLLEINQRRYAAERAYSLKKNSKLKEHADAGMMVTVARSMAEIDALEELEAWHKTKAEYHYAEDTERALRTQIMSMLNVNKSVSAHYGSYR